MSTKLGVTGNFVSSLYLLTDVLNIHCDLISESLVEGKETDIIFSFGTGTLQSSYHFVLEPRRMIFNPVNKTRVSSIRIYVTDGLRRPVYLNHADTAFSIIFSNSLIIHAALTQIEHLILVRWMDLETE